MINNPDYKWYVISERGIEGGWEYKEDAQDFKRDEGPFSSLKFSLYGRKKLLSIGLDPDDDNSWSKGPYPVKEGPPPELSGLSDEEILSLAHSLTEKPHRLIAQKHVTKPRWRRK